MQGTPQELLIPLLLYSHVHSVSVITKGKYSVLEAGALPCLVTLLSDEDSEVRLNTIKVYIVTQRTPLNIRILYFSHVHGTLLKMGSYSSTTMCQYWDNC